MQFFMQNAKCKINIMAGEIKIVLAFYKSKNFHLKIGVSGPDAPPHTHLNNPLLDFEV